MTLYFLKYNNYYNRIIKQEASLSDYLEYALGSPMTGVNFVPNDGVNTEQVVNRRLQDIGDYLLVVNDLNEIESKWFIIESHRLRNGQYRLLLRRDIIADNYNEVVNAPCFIEKATLEQSDPMIYNSEDMTFNQIKTSEALLKDETGSAWIVGYLSADHTEDKTVQIDPQYLYDTIESLDDWEYAGNNLIWGVNPSGWTMNISMKCATNGTFGGGRVQSWHRYSFNASGDQPILPANGLYEPDVTGANSIGKGLIECNAAYEQFSVFADMDKGTITFANKWDEPTDSIKNALKNAFTNIYPYMESFIKQQEGYTDVESILNNVGKIYYVTNENRFYKLVVSKSGQNNYVQRLNIGQGQLYNKCREAYLNAYNSNTNAFNSLYSNANDPNNFNFDLTLNTESEYYAAYLEPISEPVNYSITISKSRPHLNDAPYDMFCIPYSDGFDIYRNGNLILQSSQNIAFATAMSLQRELSGAGFIYDVQLLPYCPLREYIRADGTFDIQNGKVDFITKTENNQQVNAGIIIYAYNSSFTLNIPYTITIKNNKLENLTDKYRLCSPNYNGQFEFSAAKNNGVNYFNVDCTYKPYNPYIHINPNFSNLYGYDFNDARGLICSGDFSLPAITDAWATYELQNKNYQQQFDRQIQNMEVNNSIAIKQQQWQAAAGALSSTISGATTGAMVGGPVGALVGGLVGGAASTAAGIADIQYTKQLQAEAIDYTKDQFGYQLGNIQALPYSLSKTTAFTYNNKIFPLLEYYTCTEQEKQALRDKLKYNGMTVMRIGTISEFIQPEPSYIKGKLIRLEGINDDFHVVNEIANEINKGVFI